MLRKKEFLLTIEGKEYLVQKHKNEGCTFQMIADEFGTNKSYIARVCKKHNIEANNRSESQKNSIASGRSKHPTAGKIRSEDEKILISERMKKVWNNKTDEEKELHRQKARDIFLSLSEETRKEYIKKSIDTNRLVAAVEGSKLEKYIVSQLIKQGIKVKLHSKYVIENEEMHVDIMLPEFDIAIEVDGPSHFKNIYGEDILKKRVEKDAVKNWLLVSAGYIVIRARFPRSYVSKSDLREFTKKLLEVIDYINTMILEDSEDFKKLENRIIYLDGQKKE